MPILEVELQMPQFVEGTIRSENGRVLSIGDKVSHDEMGLGSVARHFLSQEHGFRCQCGLFQPKLGLPLPGRANDRSALRHFGLPYRPRLKYSL